MARPRQASGTLAFLLSKLDNNSLQIIFAGMAQCSESFSHFSSALSQWRPIMKRCVSVATPAKVRSKFNVVISKSVLAVFLFATPANADDYDTVANAVASPLVNRQE